MKRFTLSLFAVLAFLVLAPEAQAQWVRTYRPVYRRVYQPVFVAPPVTSFQSAPMVIYQPSTVLYSRRRPVLGGTVVRSRPAYRRSVVW